MIPGYVRERKRVKLCSLSFSLFKKIKFKMAKFLGNAKGNLCRFCTLFRFPVRVCLNVRGGGIKPQEGNSARREWRISTGFYCMWFGNQ